MMATFRTRSFLQDDGPLALGVQGLTCTSPPMIGIMILVGHRLAVDARRGGDHSHHADAVGWIVVRPHHCLRRGRSTFRAETSSGPARRSVVRCRRALLGWWRGGSRKARGRNFAYPSFRLVAAITSTQRLT